MLSSKQLKLADKAAQEQQKVLLQLNDLVKDIDRCEKTISALRTELEAVNEKHKNRNSTREDIAYLTDLLDCAKKKLAWEKQMASLQKRTPALLQTMTRLMNDPNAPPSDQTRADMLHALQAIQSAMERLNHVKVQ
jgi:DNA repair exonuclease SbcCD ATPase subunit